MLVGNHEISSNGPNLHAGHEDNLLVVENFSYSK